MSDDNTSGNTAKKDPCQHHWIGDSWIDSEGNGGGKFECCKCGKPITFDKPVAVTFEGTHVVAVAVNKDSK